jgi:DNA modification methylase
MKQYSKNPRKISDEQRAELESFLRELGDLSGVVHDLNSDQIIGGNQRSKVFDINKCEIVIEHQMKKPDSQGTVALGYVIWEKKRYSYRQVRWTKKQCEKANIVANKAGGEWDEELLAQFFKGTDLANWGFSDDEVEDLFAQQTKKKVDAKPRFDEADKLLKSWKVKLGDLWALGDHRLVCGDSSDPATVHRLVGKESVASLFSTDAPYMVDYDGTARPGGGRDWGDKYKESTIEDKQQFLTSVFQAWHAYLKPNAAWFIWHASSTRALFEQAMTECGILIHQEIIWVKPVFVIGFATYYFQHEPCLFGWPKGKKPYVRKRFFDGGATTVWNQAQWDEHQEDILAELHQNSTVWFLDWQGKKRNSKALHPTEKPVEIFARPMRNHTRSGEICLEPFSGSGSQLLAGEQEGRRVYASEIEPAFAAVGLQRFEDATGIKPKLLERGK